MSSLQPQRGDDKVAVPFSFDSKWNTLELRISKVYILFAACIVAFILWIVVMIIASSDNIRLWGSIILLLGVPTVLRFAVVEEGKFMKNYRMLREHDYIYDYSLFWSIYDSSTTAPTVFYHISGLYSIFVAFDKDVVVGKGNDSDFEHYDALSDAYNLLAKKGISCVHVDYMDNVGKDVRLAGMMEKLEVECKAEDLKNCVLDMYSYLQWYMSDTYSDYDVYCFTTKMRPDLFLDELNPVLNAFLNANYIRYRVLDRADLRDLVASVMSIPDFSVTRSCDGLFASRGLTSYLKIIWTERDGVREKVNKTKAEIAADARIVAEEKEARKRNKHRKKSASADAAVDLFDDATPEATNAPKKPSAFAQATKPTVQKAQSNAFTQATQRANPGNTGARANNQLPMMNNPQGTTVAPAPVAPNSPVRVQPSRLNTNKAPQGVNSNPQNTGTAQEDEFNLFSEE